MASKPPNIFEYTGLLLLLNMKVVVDSLLMTLVLKVSLPLIVAVAVL